jgi:hypothetical protein
MMTLTSPLADFFQKYALFAGVICVEAVPMKNSLACEKD